MVPLDGFSLACNIFQAISFTREVYSQVKDIVDQGKGDYDGALITSKAEKLTAFCNDIADKEKPITGTSLLSNARLASVTYGLAIVLKPVATAFPSTLRSASDSKGDAELLRVAEKCRTATKEFRDVIIGLDFPSGKGNLWKAFKSWAKTARNRKIISKLEKCVREHEKLLDSFILKELLTKTNAIALQRRSDFAQLDSQLQRLIGLVQDGRMDIKALVDELNSAITAHVDGAARRVESVVATDGQATRDLFDATFRQDQQVKAFDKLLHSIQSETANMRQIEVADAHETTYEWVFNPGNPEYAYHSISFETETESSRDDSWSGEETGSGKDEDTPEIHLCNISTASRMDCFVCWLSSPQVKPYWVCGKPGSGKSTLMRYIVQSLKTRSTLETVYGHDVLILSHFIYLHGQRDQRSRRGILLSLTHQYLSHNPDKAAKMQLVQSIAGALQQRIPKIFLKGTSSEWSYGELEDLLLALLERSQRQVVIFIDGLDEVEIERQVGSPSPVLDLVDKLCRLPRVHVCVSSRPEKVFVDKFTKDAHLTLQELTRHDISKYVTDHLRQFYIEDNGRRIFLEKLVNEILFQSDGVFLWACIATKNLAEALGSGDDDQMVMNRLNELPRDINDLYKAMLERLKDGHTRYQSLASEYLQAVLRDHTAVLRRMSCTITDLFSEDKVKRMLEKIISNPECRYTWARSECEKFAQFVPLRTFYLVEVDGIIVRLLHRSAADFLETPDGQEILKHYKPSEESETALYLWRTLLFAALQHEQERFLLGLDVFISHLEKYVLDSRPQLAISLFLVCQRLYYARMRRDSPASLVFPDVLKRGYCFNSFLARIDVPKFLFLTITVDIGSLKITQGSLQDDWSLRRQVPLVYSPDYLLFLVYQSLVGFYLTDRTFKQYFWNGVCYIDTDSDTYSWLMQSACVPAKSQQTLKPYVSLASIISTSLQWRTSITTADIKALQAALDMEGAWDEQPVCTLWLDRGNIYFDVYGLHRGIATLKPPYRSNAGYVVQVTMGFLVYCALARLYITSPDRQFVPDPLTDSLLDEVKKRYPSGIPPARVFAGFQCSNNSGSRTATYFTLSPDHLLHISMPSNPSEIALTFSGRDWEMKSFKVRGSGQFLPLFPLRVYKNDLGEDYESAIAGGGSGDYTHEDKEWYVPLDPMLSSSRQIRLDYRSGDEGTPPSGFWESSNLDRQVVSEEQFVQEVSKWRETTFDYTE